MSKRPNTDTTRRQITRTRTKNFKTPEQDDVIDSIRKLIAYARKRAVRDHDDSFATGRERDLVASVYLTRARDLLQDRLDEEQ